MNFSSRIALEIARRLKRGYWPLIRWAANRDKSLQDLRIPMPDYPGHHLRADLRESVFIPLYRCGRIPHRRRTRSRSL